MMMNPTMNSRLLQDLLGSNEDDLDLSPARDIPPANMAVAACPILFVALVSLYLKLGNVRTLLLAGTRCVCQLLLLGLILYPVFRNNQPYVVLPYLLVMIVFATREASVKPKHNYDGMTRHIFCAVTCAVSVSLSVIGFGVLQPDPWQDAQVIIPVGGMMLGSCVNALSLGMDRFLLSLRGDGPGSATLQTYLAVGGNRWEIALPSIREAIETGLTPNLNQMSVMGLVSIPGMLTGQLLSGTPPIVAAKYQIVIMFFVCSNSTTTLFLVLLQAVFWGAVFDSINFNFQANKVHKRAGGKPKDIVLAAISNLGSLCQYLYGVIQGNNNKQTDTTMTTTESDVEKGLSSHPSSVRSGQFVPANPGNGGNWKAKSASDPLLTLSNGAISVGGTPLVSNLNIQIQKGEILFLTGPSGCGKSTCMKALAKLEVLEEGTLSLHGKSDHFSAATVWRTEVLYVRQAGGQGLQGTPKELLADLCCLEAPYRRLKGNIESVVGRFEQNLRRLDLPSNMMDTRWDQFSGGESQRVYLCLMLALDPSIILLDEPTSACDELAAKKIEQLIVGSGIATVWVSHDPSQIERLQQFDQTSVLTFQMEEVEKSDSSESVMEAPKIEDTA